MSEHNPTLEAVDAYEVPSFLSERIALNYRVPQDFAEGLIREAKRMLYLSNISDDSVAPSDRVDWAWHEMILFTRFYKEFAQFIGGFIHHVPNPPDGKSDKNETWEEIQSTLNTPRLGSATYQKTKENYLKFFGAEPDPLYWP